MPPNTEKRTCCAKTVYSLRYKKRPEPLLKYALPKIYLADENKKMVLCPAHPYNRERCEEYRIYLRNINILQNTKHILENIFISQHFLQTADKNSVQIDFRLRRLLKVNRKNVTRIIDIAQMKNPKRNKDISRKIEKVIETLPNRKEDVEEI